MGNLKVLKSMLILVIGDYKIGEKIAIRSALAKAKALDSIAIRSALAKAKALDSMLFCIEAYSIRLSK